MNVGHVGGESNFCVMLLMFEPGSEFIFHLFECQDDTAQQKL